MLLGQAFLVLFSSLTYFVDLVSRTQPICVTQSPWSKYLCAWFNCILVPDVLCCHTEIPRSLLRPKPTWMATCPSIRSSSMEIISAHGNSCLSALWKLQLRGLEQVEGILVRETIQSKMAGELQL